MQHEIIIKLHGLRTLKSDVQKNFSQEFITLGVPEKGTIIRDKETGNFILKMQKETLKGNSPSFTAVRLQHKCCEISAELVFQETEEDDCAGLVILQNDKNHIRFEYYDKEKDIRVISCCKGKEEKTEEFKGEMNALKIVINGLTADFWWKNKSGWNMIVQNMDLKFLSTESAGGFTGCTVGIYASANGKKSRGYAIFKNFKYTFRDDA